MSDKPLAGGTKWTNEGIEPAKAFWTEVYAYQKALNDRVRQLPEGRAKNEMLEILNDMGHSLLGLRSALYELELIGIEAKKDRLND